jgi:hypothetical protein
MKLKKALPVLLLIAAVLLIAVPFVSAQTPLEQSIKNNLGSLGAGAGYSTTANDLPTTVGKIINVFLAFLGVIFVILMVYAGYLWMTSLGDSARTKKAKELMTDGVIGLVIILAAYSISNFVVGNLINATTK